jgi:hypothetical protein
MEEVYARERSIKLRQSELRITAPLTQQQASALQMLLRRAWVSIFRRNPYTLLLCPEE